MDQSTSERIPRPVWLVGTATALILFGDQALYAILPTCASEYGLVPFQVGLILSLNRWVRLLTNHLAERLVHRVSPTRLLLVGFGLGVVLTFTYAATPVFAIFLIARLLWGLCWSLIRQVGIMTSVDCSTEANKGEVVGLYSGLARIGSFVGMVVGGALYDTLGLGFSLTFILLGIASLFSLPLGAVARRGLRSHESVFRNPPPESQPGQVFGLLACAFVIGCVGPGVIVSTLGLILKWRVGEGFTVFGVFIGVATLTGLLLSTRYMLNALTARKLGALLDRTGHHMGTVVCFCVATVLLLAATYVSSVLALAGLVFAFFVCATSINVALMAEAGRAGSRPFALYASASDFGAAVGPVLAWTIYHLSHSPTLSLAVGCCIYAVGALFAYARLRRSGARD